MPSPFPGMNPYLEHPNIWHDFHGAFAFRLRDYITERLSPGYFVKVDENVYIHELSAEERRLLGRPDVGIAHGGRQDWNSNREISLLDAPSVVHHRLAIDELREPFLQIIDSKSREIVTIIELLSPSNKGSDRDLYLAKRNRILKSASHLVEIDFLRSGERMPEVDLPACDYAVMVSRRESRPEAGYWPIQLRDPIPLIPFPLRRDEIIRIDLKIIIEQVYEAAHYQNEIYSDPITPPLSNDDAAWVSQILTSAGISVGE